MMEKALLYEKYLTNKKILILILLVILIALFWIKEPPFYKQQHIKVVDIERWTRGNEIRKEKYKRVYYTYELKSGEVISGDYMTTQYVPNIGQFEDKDVYTPFKKGGEFTINLYMAIFIILSIVFLFQEIKKKRKIKNEKLF